MGASTARSKGKRSKEFNNNGSFKDRYDLTSTELGSGAFSIVKLAIELENSEKRAVKIVEKKKLNAEDTRALLMEIEILKHLDHEHIIRLYTTWEEPKQYLIVTEIVLGGELFDRIVNKSHYSEKEARELIRIMLSTLEYIHRAGVVHRDLKPENLLLCSEENDHDIKFADFGFAKHVKDLQPKEVACGTPGYVAPEVLRSDPYGTEVDIWSMGVICYVLLAGYPPFYDEDQRRLFKKIQEGRYQFHEDYWGSISSEAVDLIKNMLVVKQSNRWTASRLLEHPWLKMDDSVLQDKDLSHSQITMKKFNARRRLKAAADAIVLANRMKNGLKSSKEARAMKGPIRGVIDMTIVEQSESVVLEDTPSATNGGFFTENKYIKRPVIKKKKVVPVEGILSLSIPPVTDDSVTDNSAICARQPAPDKPTSSPTYIEIAKTAEPSAESV